MSKIGLIVLLPALAFVPVALAAPQSIEGSQQLTQRIAKEKTLNLPTRGMSMAQVKKKFGEPLRKLDPRGGDTPKHPTIKRWQYTTYIVYFEHDHVIHTVLNTPAGNNKHPDKVH